MLTFRGKKGARFCDGLTRRDFLRAGALSGGAIGLSLADLGGAGAAHSGEQSCILLFLVGGPSHLDTFDPKPDAPEDVRGPFRPTQTNVPGVQVCEHFPRMARVADRYAIVRSVHHREAPIHETGHQLMQTGRLCRDGQEPPHYGAVLSHLRGPGRQGLPPFVVVPGPIGNTGVSVGHGQSAGSLGPRHGPFVPGADVASRGVDPARLRGRRELLDAIDDAQRFQEGRPEVASSVVFTPAVRRAFDVAAERPDLRDRYGMNTFGQSCLLARRLVEHGVRLVTVNMFDTVFDRVTWDCHADGGPLGTTLNDYRDTLCPMFDAAYTALLDDLQQRGLLDTTLVVATGEFGRTPHLNSRGGRDHWPGVWSILFAGGRVRGGQVVGASDRIGAEPRDRPVTPAQVAASVYHALGVDPRMSLPGPAGRSVPLTDAQPIAELFR
jgi:hypothetical protein